MVSLLDLYCLSLVYEKKENFEEAARLCSEALLIEKQHKAGDHTNVAIRETTIALSN